MTEPSVVGSAKLKSLDSVKPNRWNPNTLTPLQYASLKHGLETEGWYASQALLVWGSDEKGKRKNIIIDGEHRWRAASELGFTDAPMVVLQGLTEAKAKALTIKLDSKRGKFKQKDLSELLSSLVQEMNDEDDLALSLGFSDEEFARLQADAPAPMSPPPAPVVPTVSENDKVKQVPLFIASDRHEKFSQDVQKLMVKYKSKSVTEAILRATKEAWEATV